MGEEGGKAGVLSLCFWKQFSLSTFVELSLFHSHCCPSLNAFLLGVLFEFGKLRKDKKAGEFKCKKGSPSSLSISAHLR